MFNHSVVCNGLPEKINFSVKRISHPVQRFVSKQCQVIAPKVEDEDKGNGNMCLACAMVLELDLAEKEVDEEYGIIKDPEEKAEEVINNVVELAQVKLESDEGDRENKNENVQEEEEIKEEPEDEEEGERKRSVLSERDDKDSSEVNGVKRVVKNAKMMTDIFTCDVCGKVYKYHGSLQRHHEVAHGSGAKPNTEEAPVGPDGKKLRVRHINYKCEFCQKPFESKSLYLEHRTTHTGEKLYYCDECGRGFGFVSAYNYHRKVHLREKGLLADKDQNSLYHYCEHCGKRFTCPRIMRRHIKVKHMGYSTECRCETCGEVCKNRDRLLEHVNKNHRTDSRYQCQICEKRFGSKNMLDRHQIVHNDPQFECKFCGKKVKKLESLKSHERIHTGETPFR